MCQTFHDLALETWYSLDKGSRVEFTIGEETITDNNLFVIQSLHPDKVRIIKFSKAKESKIGADWEWWLGNPCKGWIKMRIQAKKIDSKYLVYKKIGHPKGINTQIQNLLSKSQSEGFFPAYCLYSTRLPARLPAWGCAILSANSMQRVLMKQSKKSNEVEFSKIQSFAFPWEKLVCELDKTVPFPKRIQMELMKISPSNYNALNECFSENLSDYVERLMKPFYEGSTSNIIGALGELEEPPAKYLVVISDQSIFKRFFRDEEDNYSFWR